jgi:hypothetical protein
MQLFKCTQQPSHPAAVQVQACLPASPPRAHLEQVLDEDPAAAGGVVFCEADTAQHPPTDGIVSKQMSKQLGDIAELVGL